MIVSNPSPGDIVERGTRIYEEQLRHILEPQHIGKYLVIDVETGEYELDEDHLAASDRAAAKRPGARLYAMRVGSRSVGRVGGRWSATPSA
jgi:hypothetical protein